MKDFIFAIIETAAEHFQKAKAESKAEQTAKQSAFDLVSMEWMLLIHEQGTDAAKTFMQECRERQICPSTHLDLTDFLDAGKAAMKAFSHPPINSTI